MNNKYFIWKVKMPSYAKPERYYPDQEKGNTHGSVPPSANPPEQSSWWTWSMIVLVIFIVILIIIFIWYCFSSKTSNFVQGYKKIVTTMKDCDGNVVKEKFLVPVKLQLNKCAKICPTVYTIVPPAIPASACTIATE